jgi:hypothetical protein
MKSAAGKGDTDRKKRLEKMSIEEKRKLLREGKLSPDDIWS